MSRSQRATVAVSVVAASLCLAVVPLAATASAAPAPRSETPICASTTPNGRFVRWIYLNILNRCPDSGGRAYWTAQLDQGMDRWAFARRIDYSDENIRKNNVDSIYDEILHRAPTASEASAAAASIRTTEGDGRLIAMLASSDEFYATLDGATKAEKDQAWLTFAYNGIVDRNPDSAGRAHYTAVLGADGSTEATRQQVALSLELSHENARGWVGAVYGAALNRAPDPSGAAYWEHWLLTTGFRSFRMWTGFLSSDEADRIAQTQPNPPAEPAVAHQQGLRFW